MNYRDSSSASDDPIILRGIDLTANRVQMSNQLAAMSLLGGTEARSKQGYKIVKGS